MPKLDESRPFIPVRIALLTVSDTRTLADDRSGDALSAMVREAGHIEADGNKRAALVELGHGTPRVRITVEAIVSGSGRRVTKEQRR